MSHGFRVTNANNQVVIDSNYRNHQLILETTQYFARTGSYHTLSFSSADQHPPLVFCRPPVGGGIILGELDGGPGAWTAFNFYVTASANYDFQIFDSLGLPPTGTHGMRVRGPDGVPVFDSRVRHLRATKMVVAPLDSSFAETHDEAFDPDDYVQASGAMIGRWNYSDYQIWSVSAPAIRRTDAYTIRISWDEIINAPIPNYYLPHIFPAYHGMFGRATN